MPIEQAAQRETSTTNETDRKQKRRRWLVWVKLGLSASIPLMIALFTIISYVQTNQMNERNRQKDIEIANQARLQEQKLADDQHREDQRKFDEQRLDDQRKADELHYQTLFGNYIDEISSALYKQPGENQSMFSSENKKMLYIRRKTLLTLRSINSDRKSQLFIFLLENNLLPDATKPESTVSLTGADLSNITIRSPITGRYSFSWLSLLSVNLMDATFINCDFDGQTDFSGSSLANAQFLLARFGGHLNAIAVNLTNASFTNCSFSGQTDFTNSMLIKAQFSFTTFHGKLNAASVSFTNASFNSCNFLERTYFLNSNLSSVDFRRTWFPCPHIYHIQRDNIFSQNSMAFTDFREAFLCDIAFEHVDLSHANFGNATLRHITFIDSNLSHSTVNITADGNFTLKNVFLPNGTWVINSSNLVKNNDAEENCESFDGTIMYWSKGTGIASLYHHNQNATEMGFCSFACQDDNGFLISQTVDLSDIYLFILSGEAEYRLSAYFGGRSGQCKEGQVRIYLFVNSNVSLINHHIPFSEPGIQWQYHEITSPIMHEYLQPHEFINIQFELSSQECYVDNIELHVKQRLDKY